MYKISSLDREIKLVISYFFFLPADFLKRAKDQLLQKLGGISAVEHQLAREDVQAYAASCISDLKPV